jgi:hypothetical protein
MDTGQIFKFGNWYDSIANAFFEIANTKKAAKNFKARVILTYPNGRAETYYGFTDATNRFLICPDLMREWIGPKPIYLDGIKTFIAPFNSGKCVDVEELAKLNSAITYDAIVSWMHLRTWCSLKVENVTGTLDLTLYDTDGSQMGCDCSAMAYSVTSSKNMEFLNDVPRRVYILSMLLSGAIGGIIFSFMTLIFAIILTLIASGLK